MGFGYEWRELTNHGLLVFPEKVGPYYDRVDINKCGGFRTESDAIEAYHTIRREFPGECPPELVLVRYYTPEVAVEE
jgi:hypothetical protein